MFSNLKSFPEQGKRTYYVESEAEDQALSLPSWCIPELTFFDRTKPVRNYVT